LRSNYAHDPETDTSHDRVTRYRTAVGYASLSLHLFFAGLTAFCLLALAQINPFSPLKTLMASVSYIAKLDILVGFIAPHVDKAIFTLLLVLCLLYFASRICVFGLTHAIQSRNGRNGSTRRAQFIAGMSAPPPAGRDQHRRLHSVYRYLHLRPAVRSQPCGGRMGILFLSVRGAGSACYALTPFVTPDKLASVSADPVSSGAMETLDTGSNPG
jgi:hypothetical protein